MKVDLVLSALIDITYAEMLVIGLKVFQHFATEELKSTVAIREKLFVCVYEISRT